MYIMRFVDGTFLEFSHVFIHCYGCPFLPVTVYVQQIQSAQLTSKLLESCAT